MPNGDGGAVFGATFDGETGLVSGHQQLQQREAEALLLVFFGIKLME